MNNLVYLGGPWLKPAEKALREYGFEVLVGGGPLDDKLLARCWAMMPGREPVTESVLERAPNLKLICKQGVGLDRIDIPACTRRGICVANTPGGNLISVAEHTIALMLAAAKQLYPISLYIRRDYPEFGCAGRYPAAELYGKTLAVIGLGNIGRRVAKLADAFEMKVIGVCRRTPPAGLPEYIELADSLEEALPRADFVSLHVSGVEANRGLIGERELALMRDTAILINTTRGFVVDEQALYRALVNRTIAGAGLDVFADEPFRPCNPLMHLENLVATPHSAANTPESRRRSLLQCAEIIRDYAGGRRPLSAANDVPVG